MSADIKLMQILSDIDTGTNTFPISNCVKDPLWLKAHFWCFKHLLVPFFRSKIYTKKTILKLSFLDIYVLKLLGADKKKCHLKKCIHLHTTRSIKVFVFLKLSSGTELDACISPIMLSIADLRLWVWEAVS